SFGFTTLSRTYRSPPSSPMAPRRTPATRTFGSSIRGMHAAATPANTNAKSVALVHFLIGTPAALGAALLVAALLRLRLPSPFRPPRKPLADPLLEAELTGRIERRAPEPLGEVLLRHVVVLGVEGGPVAPAGAALFH